jgi:hypothetical protein
MAKAKKKKTKKRDKFKYSGSHPEESYEIGTDKNLYLDKPSTHGGWPEGEYSPTVNKQISSWLKSMKLLKEYIKEYVRTESL